MLPRQALQPIGPLMIEHRLIERLIDELRRETERIRDTRSVDTDLLYRVIDFLHTYVDRTHHGKEEDILFAALEDKPLTDEQRALMSELTAEHETSVELIERLRLLRRKHLAEGEGVLDEIIVVLDELVEFYPLHIFKEDRRFFLPVMAHFTDDEMTAMLERMKSFDQGMIHEKYSRLVDGLKDG